MDQVKIGKFIAERRKEKNITQMQLAEKLNITDRAISKWETGKGMPDSSIMLELCNELDISVNELLSGEMIDMREYDKRAEENLIEMKKMNEENTKRMLALEYVIGFSCSITFITMIFIASYIQMDDILRILLIILGSILFMVGCAACLMIEQKAGYYECKHCGNKYVPTYNQVLFSKHMGRTRYMKCPKCEKKTWNKKVVAK